MPLYELLCLVQPTLPRATLQKLIERSCQTVFANDGVVTKVTSNGVNRLAYTIKKVHGHYDEAFIWQLAFHSSPAVLPEVRHQIATDERCLRHQITTARELPRIKQSALFRRYLGSIQQGLHADVALQHQYVVSEDNKAKEAALKLRAAKAAKPKLPQPTFSDPAMADLHEALRAPASADASRKTTRDAGSPGERALRALYVRKYGLTYGEYYYRTQYLELLHPERPDFESYVRQLYDQAFGPELGPQAYEAADAEEISRLLHADKGSAQNEAQAPHAAGDDASEA